MAINYDELISRKVAGVPYAYGDRETMLYALGVGMSRNPLDVQELRFTFEKDLKAIPTMAALFGVGGQLLQGLNHAMVVHGEQRLTLHRPLPWNAQLVVTSRVAAALDKGPEKGAVIYLETTALLKSGAPLTTAVATIFARGDGGFGGPAGPPPFEIHAVPDRKPDKTCELVTREDQALIYRLSGDRNPLHADPGFAVGAGFPRPILHGLCTYGFACRAILRSICDYDPAKIAGFDARFSAPVFPGETLVTDMWVDGNIVSHRTRVKERDVVVVNNGRAVLKSASEI